ncbi:MAG: DUF362 domain-containing protein [Bacteroidales bacterium]|nr:DUF362 domain-containing protein [Bacteroidales bacterium]
MKPIVSLIACSSYEEKLVKDAVKQSIDMLGGIHKFIKPGQRVLLKANLLRAAAPTEMVSTHPSVIKAVVELVRDAGAHPVIGDSPGGPFTNAWMRLVYQTTGMQRLAEESGAELNWDFGHSLVSHPGGHLIKALEVANYVTQADVVITFPKLKTHTFMQFTGATKILFGAIPGTTKVGYHAKFPQPERFGDMLIDILTLVKPALSIMDAVVGMDGNGPSAGNPFEIGAILASSDAVALDVVAASLVGMDIRSIYPLQAAIRRGLSNGKLSDIEILGEPFDKMKVENFQAPETGTRQSAFSRLLTRQLKNILVAAPYANDDCIGCGICAQNCPVEAITIIDKHAHMDLDSCIRCYCCHEMCPEKAVDLRKPWLGRLFG